MTDKPSPPQRAGQRKRRKRATKKQSLFQSLRRRDIILLMGVLGLACFGVLMIVFIALGNAPAVPPENAAASQTPRPEPTHTVSFVEVTGLGQYRIAEEAAQAWAADAQLVSASADWPQVLDISDVGTPVDWSYRFYSVEKAKLYFVVVTTDGEVRTIEHIETVTLPPRTINTEAWATDSPAALAHWLDNGGAELLRTNPGLELLVQLRSVSDVPNPVWVVVGVDNRTEDLLVVVVDANQGIVTNTSPES